MLALKNVEVVYDDVILVLKGLSLEVPKGRIVALLGSNGAGKSTTLKAISGLLGAEEGEVTDGSIELDGERIDRLAPGDKRLLQAAAVIGKDVPFPLLEAIAEESEELSGVNAFFIGDVLKDRDGELVVRRLGKLRVQLRRFVLPSDHEPDCPDEFRIRELPVVRQP